MVIYIEYIIKVVKIVLNSKGKKMVSFCGQVCMMGANRQIHVVCQLYIDGF